MRYRIDLAYRGTAYHGWQRQQNALSVQEVLEARLAQLVGTHVEVVGAGRTDTGVHASRYVAHFDAPTLRMPLARMEYALNGILPSDISVYSLQETHPEFHARFDAIARTYRYVIARTKDPFSLGLAYQCAHALDYDLMQQGAHSLLRYTDFASFCKAGADNKTTICHLMRSEWTVEDAQWVYTVQANRFLRNMVRALVGTLLDLGRGRISLDQLHDIVAAADRGRAGASAPPEGLYLAQIDYPE